MYDTKTCPSGKVRYLAEVDAEMVLNYIRAPHRPGGRKRKERSTYHCKICDGWHLTSIGRSAQY